MAITPEKILLATDFSSRCDRALDRSIQLMKQHNSELIILYVIEPFNEFHTFYRKRFLSSHTYREKLAEKAMFQMQKSIAPESGRVKIVIRKGDTADVILEVASEERCDLIICGVARDVMFGHHALGRTVNKLLRRSDFSLLIVTSRMTGAYSKILVASDMSDVSREAIKTSVSLFRGQKLDVLYAEDAYGSHAVDAHKAYHEQIKKTAQQEFASFIDSTGLSGNDRKNINVIVEWGRPALLIQEFAEHSSADLVVIGSRIRNPLIAYFFESTAKRIISMLSCDSLVIRGCSD